MFQSFCYISSTSDEITEDFVTIYQ